MIINKLVNRFKKVIFTNRNHKNNVTPKIFFCHVPKCAGVSVSNQIWQVIYAGHEIGTFNIDLQASQKSAQIFQMDRMDIREFVLAYNLSVSENYYGAGHVCCRPGIIEAFQENWNFVTILRNPVDRWISEYVYNTYKSNDWEKNILPIDEYLETRKAWITGISFIRYFSNLPSDFDGDDYGEFVEEAVENLKRFSVIGFVEQMGNWCLSFEKKFGNAISIPRSNVSPLPEAVKNIRSDKRLMEKNRNPL